MGAMSVISVLTVTGVTWAVSGAEACENFWRNCKELPQYKYIARPVYKFVASHSNTIIATAASFFVTDLIMHQLLPSTLKCVFSRYCDISWRPGNSLGWVALSLPVMYAKYKRNSPNF